MCIYYISIYNNNKFLKAMNFRGRSGAEEDMERWEKYKYSTNVLNF